MPIRLPSFDTAIAMQAYQTMRQGSAILASVALAKSSLSVAEIGSFEQLLFVGSACTFFWASGLLQGLLPIWPSLDERGHKTLIFNSLSLFAAFSAGLFGLLFWGQKWLVPLLAGRAELPHFELFLAWLAVGTVSLPVEQFLMLKKKPLAIAAWGAAGFGLHVLAVAAPVLMGFGLKESLICLLALALAKAAVAIAIAFRWGCPRFEKPLLKRYLSLSAPLMASQIVGNFVVVFDAWLVGQWFADERRFAVFRFGARELPLALAFTTGLSMALVPTVAQHFGTGLSELRRRSRRLGDWLFPLSIALVLISKPMFRWAFRPEFEASALIFSIYLLHVSSRLTMTHTVMLAKGESKAIFGFSIFELALKLPLGVLMLWRLGLPGLALSSVAVFWTEKLGHAWFLKKKHGIRLGQIVDLKHLLLWSAALAIAVSLLAF